MTNRPQTDNHPHTSICIVQDLMHHALFPNLINSQDIRIFSPMISPLICHGYRLTDGGRTRAPEARTTRHHGAGWGGEGGGKVPSRGPIYTSVCIYIYTHTHTHTCIHTSMHACMYACSCPTFLNPIRAPWPGPYIEQA